MRLGVYETVLEAAEAYARYVKESGVEEEAPPPEYYDALEAAQAAKMKEAEEVCCHPKAKI